MTLPSNNDTRHFKNEISSYRTKLAKRIKLEGNWEVGLCSISFTNSWINIPKDEFINIHFYNEPVEQVILPKGLYTNISNLLKPLNSILKAKHVQLQKKSTEYDVPTFSDKNKTSLTLTLAIYKNLLVFPEMSKDLCNILGFSKETLDLLRITTFAKYKNKLLRNPFYDPSHTNKEQTIEAEHRPEIFGKFHTMFLYCDLIESVFYGEKFVPLLRFIEIPSNSTYGAQVVSNYPECSYIPLQRKEFDSVEITIKDEDGEYFPFQHGRVIVLLHFRKNYNKTYCFQ